MTANLLVIFCVASEDPVCRLFLPYWRRSGCDLLFSSPLDAPSGLEGVSHVNFGRSIQHADRSTWWHLQSRVLDTMKACLRMSDSGGYDGFVFTQYDSITLDPLPVIESPDCIMHTFENNDPAFKARHFHHPPWCMGHDVLEQFIDEASRHDIRTSEHGIMDRWQSWVLECAGIAVAPSNAWSWSANSIDTPELVADCRAAIARGARFVHGVKNKQQLDAILEGQP